LTAPHAPRRIVVAITGASGAVYGVRLLSLLRAQGGTETHLVISAAGARSLLEELGLRREDCARLADVVHPVTDIGAAIASGSYPVDAMVVAPCSANTLAGIANGISGNLVTRAADVCLKERRRLVLLVRETPLHLVHLRNMESVTLMGGIVFPPVPAFYQRPGSVEEIVDHTLARVLDLVGVPHDIAPRWGIPGTPAAV
jgi:polyprenyl P-hydroxybenzoate/phenylacrylic acid decarboxylase-like protein